MPPSATKHSFSKFLFGCVAILLLFASASVTAALAECTPSQRRAMRNSGLSASQIEAACNAEDDDYTEEDTPRSRPPSAYPSNRRASNICVTPFGSCQIMQTG